MALDTSECGHVPGAHVGGGHGGGGGRGGGEGEAWRNVAVVIAVR